MLISVIENYLESIKEIQLFLPFLKLLDSKGYFDLHITHGPTEFGKDIIGKNKIDGKIVQFCFQLKAGNINQIRFRNEIQNQLIEAITNKLSHPNFDKTIESQLVFVTSGSLSPNAALAFQEFNEFVEKTLNSRKVIYWGRNELVNYFYAHGINAFYSIHNSPEFIGRFFYIYSKIRNLESLNFIEIENYTRNWLLLDWSQKESRLQCFFETYFFSKLLTEGGNQYEAVLFISSLIRVLIKNDDIEEYKDAILDYTKELIWEYANKIGTKRKSGKGIASLCNGIFSIFEYPKICLRLAELLSLYVLISDESDNRIIDLICKILDEEPGVERPLSDNYTITIVMVCLALLKDDDLIRAKRYLNNVTIWLCDRYAEIGLAQIGSSEGEEIEQLLSECLSGFTFNKTNSSFCAHAVLDMCCMIDDESLYECIANDFKAVNIILQFFHIETNEAIYSYTSDEIFSCFDTDYTDFITKEFSECSRNEIRNNQVTIRDNTLFFIMFLLRDRYFPTFIHQLIK